jgi:hydroxymethylpyrimidine pyrophosphatase-like HAD family hydrolase
MVRLVSIDVDGTLVGKSGVVSPKVWAAAERARQKGIRLAIASGRPAFGATREHALRLDPESWHVFQNGASVVDVGRNLSRSTPLPREHVARLIARRAETARCLELYTDTSWASEGNEELARMHAVCSASRPRFVLFRRSSVTWSARSGS